MKESEDLCDNYLRILASELIPATGCTEPIAIACAAARLREVLGGVPDWMKVHCSGNIIKNVAGVTVPNSGGLRGVEAAAVLGAVAGDSGRKLEVLGRVDEKQRMEAQKLLQQGICRCLLEEGKENLYIRLEGGRGNDRAEVTVQGSHSHISRVVKNNTVILENPVEGKEEKGDRSRLSIRGILDFAETVPVSALREMMERQIAYNTAISREGLNGSWGAQVGRTLIRTEGDGLRTRMKAAAAAGSDARMGGCSLPVVINSGSGNQGITVSVPVIEYAGERGADREQLYRALAVSNLIAIHQKRFIGNLSAYCGAVSAGCAAACGIAWLDGADYDTIGRVIVNTLGAVSGIVCDGAKASCAAKIAGAVEAALLAYDMAGKGMAFAFGEGLVEGDYEQTIRNFGRLGKDGMKKTDEEILHMMTEKRRKNG